jgi:hypothetical protein
MIATSPEHLSDSELLDATLQAAGRERHATAHLLAFLGELEARRLYLGQSCSSLFMYCNQVLHFSEHAAYHRIEAARAARQFPAILEMVAEGALTLTNVALLRKHLTLENHQSVLEAARHKSKDDVKYQIACLAPRPDARPLVRRLPAPARLSPPDLVTDATSGDRQATLIPEASGPRIEVAPPRPTIAPLAPDRYLLKVTVSAEAHAKLRRAQDLLRHVIPNGDPAAVIERALTLLVDQLERVKAGKTARPRRARSASATRYIPPSVRRAVWSRDAGRCAFVGPRGRCTETGRLEFHHVLPFADGGPTDVDNLALRCRAHNQFESLSMFDDPQLGPGRTQLDNNSG